MIKENKMGQDKLYGLCVEVTSHCNYRCEGCPSLNLPRGRGHMNPALFSRIFKEVGNDLTEVALWLYGESLSHPHIQEMLEGIREYKCRKKLSTTGFRLADFKDLSFFGAIDELIISINGLDEDTYNEHQKGGDFFKVLRGLEKLGEIPKNVMLTMQMVAHKDNIDQMDRARQFAKKYEFDKFIVKSFNVMNDSIDTFRKFVPLGTDYSRYDLEEITSTPSNLSMVLCSGGMVIAWDGTVNPCCFDYKGKYIIGNVRTDGVYGVWNSEDALKLREQIRAGKLIDICNLDCTAKKNIIEEDVK